jgi:hypothetical protein
MRLASLVIVALALALPEHARAGVDWSEYIDKDGTSRLPPSATPKLAASDTAAAKPAERSKAGARMTKAKTGKAKAKSRAKSKQRRAQ